MRRLADDGVREVTLLGQNINTYGKDADEGGLCALLEQSARVPGIDRLRFLTSNPFDMTEDMMRRIGQVPTVMPWLHIPAQSGHDAVLKRMKRTYTVAGYEEVVGWARRHVPGVEITSDFIVGFPGESEEEFQATIALVERVGFLQTYVFKYSVRPRTLSARRLPDDVPEDEKKRRNNAAPRGAGPHRDQAAGRARGPPRRDPGRGREQDRRAPRHRARPLQPARALRGRRRRPRGPPARGRDHRGERALPDRRAGRRDEVRESEERIARRARDSAA